MKVRLEKAKEPGYCPPDRSTKSISHAMPFFISKQGGKYFHRVRSADAHWKGGRLTHTSVRFWCGGSGFIGAQGQLYSEIPEGDVLCATCEGRAIGAGVAVSREINGNRVMFSPKRKEK